MRRGERLSVKEKGRRGGSELGSDLDLDPDKWKILWIRIWQNYADPLDLDPDPQHRVLPTHAQGMEERHHLCYCDIGKAAKKC